MKPFAERLNEQIRAKATPVMVGIDPSWEQLPPELRTEVLQQYGETLGAVAAAYHTFCATVIDQVADLVPIVKFQAAFFEGIGPAGMNVLAGLISLAKHRGLLVVLDGKRNDIGNTAEAYAQGYLGTIAVGNSHLAGWGADALTVNPFLGSEGIEPFTKTAHAHGNGLFVLVRTSNPGAGKLQDLRADGKTIYQHIADWTEEWSRSAANGADYGPVGAVVGATVPAQVAELRERMPHVLLLLPGYGAQGGAAKDIAAAFDRNGLGAVVNNSRGILYAYKKPEYAGRTWQEATRQATTAMIADLAAHTPAGQLR
jgi:orotidine-5'-phosphate decarboxylase